ncbi:MAG TPA: aa3-type cytochrome c oxidase subunit IV [Rhizomicrobium sp.]|jgi:hypothetical protein|nr:aa3-type cytochrome c oxidase subunit IV [Rhizomicrobium sp.]
MASEHQEFQHGQMDISEHAKGWHGFTVFIRWSLFGILLIMALLAIFRTH